MQHIKVSPLFSDGMVLQHGVSVPVSGESLPSARITLSFLGKEYGAQADKEGKWAVLLDSSSPGGPYSMKISSENGSITIQDIYSGDVWLCSGQSNMELSMLRVKDDFPQEWDPPVNPLIRQFFVPQEWDFSGPRRFLGGGCWKQASADTLGGFSAAAWFFARKMFETYNTPVGIILAAWGGTPAEAWMSAEALAGFPEKLAQGKKFADSAFCESLMREKESRIETWNKELAAADSGLAHAWQKPETDISSWDEMQLPGDFARTEQTSQTGQKNLTGFCGVIWLCREFEVGDSFAMQDAKVWLGTIVDSDTVYINGVEAGNTGYRYPPRKYAIPSGVMRKGKNRIVIRVVCCNGEGGITRGKPFRIFSGSESNNVIELSGTWKYRVGHRTESRPEEFFLQRQPTGLFNAMIAPLLGYPRRAVLWYQGESNDKTPNEYASLFKSLINDWRTKQTSYSSFLIPHSSFIFVQLPVFGEPEDNNESSSWAIIREAQLSALSLPMTGMAAALEFGEWNDLHPVNKKGVGVRLALAAEKAVFKKQNTSPGPLFRKIRCDKSRLLIYFDNCGAGLTASETPYVSVIEGGKSFRMPAVIESPECISVDISSINNPEKVLYAWAKNPRDRQLYNSDGLPVIPFQIANSN